MEGLAKAERRQKHLELNGAICQVRQRVSLLEDLVDSIQGSGRPSEPKASDSPEPSLVDILNCSPNELHAIADRIAKSVEQLNELLF